ncbi:Trichodiene synthase [Mycena epipterygia]|nr:Trichodiene synthase [Mycena epipterygia]
MPTALQDFQRGLVQGQVPENPVLRHFSLHLRDMYLYWDPVVANCIVCAALEFVNGCVLESRAEIRAMAVSPLAERWPSFLRAKTGVAAAYTLMIFPQSENVDIAQFMQAVPDINVFIELSNDVLSFYKEMLAGEVANYMHNKSATTGKTVDATLDDTSREVISTYERVSSYLRGSTREAWETFVKGYITFHVTQDRYRLRELDLNVA